ncbi:TPA: translation elongation factor EF-1 subunit alpha [archaeon]|jgi:elongation factor 1-alpha|uniref:Elongation factor 1-alpha n=1 Tax=Candidatus Undinarchaeum marinum TaxID=2756141 RepID=A0A832V0H5_9ARCH|nr:translation elongation factor EF-1 subunit alpha [Candidatus Undinarchaeum marinum]
MADKSHMNLVFVGHVDHGKSTSVGRILFDTGNIPEQEMKKIQEEAKTLGKETFGLAFVMDRLKEERERGLTIDVAHKKFETQKYNFTIIDAPGHRDFVKNMITGASQADAAVLVVSAKEGIQPQTKEHAWLLKTLGVNQLIVTINKMDEVDWKEERFNEVKKTVEDLLKPVGVKIDEVTFIPTAAYVTGENMTADAGEHMGWYKGLSLVKRFDELVPPEKATDKPLRMPIQDAYSITGVGVVPVGRVESGILKPGMKLIFQPSGATGEVKTVEMHHEQLTQAEPGDNVGINVRGLDKGSVKRGDVAGEVSNPPQVAETFEAQVVILQHPSAITAGYTPVIHCHTAQVACTIEEIIKKMDPKTGQEVTENKEMLKSGDSAVIRFRPTKPFVLETAADFPPLGRFAIRDMGATVGAGIVTKVTPKKSD